MRAATRLALLFLLCAAALRQAPPTLGLLEWFVPRRALRQYAEHSYRAVRRGALAACEVNNCWLFTFMASVFCSP